MNAKKLVSMILALVMLLVLGTSAMAEAETTYAYQYEIYQIFTGDYADGVLSNVKWGKNADKKYTTGEAVPEVTLKMLAALNTASDSEKLKLIKNLVNFDSKAYETVTSNETSTTVSGLPNGYYLVKDKAGTQAGENEAYTTYVVQVVNGTLTINRKVGVPTVEKKIVDGTDVDANEASIGETVNYKITGKMPSNIADYKTYYYVFTDTLSKGLTYTADSMTVTVNGKDVTNYFYIDAAENTDGSTSLTVGIQDLLALAKVEGVGEITAATEVVVTYKAVLNENAVVGENGNPNKVKLDYSNDPNNSGEGATNPPSEEKPTPDENIPTGKTPEDVVVTYTTELIIKKTDENHNVLTGAAFQIKGIGTNMVVTTGTVYVESENGTYYKLKNGTYTTTEPTEETADAYVDGMGAKKYEEKTVATITADEKNEVYVEAFVGADGILKFTGLGAGKYTITETVTPPGYNSIEPFDVTIGWNENDGWTYNGKMGSVGIQTNTITVVNQSGASLPSTGGMGTTVLYIAGGLLVAAAVLMMITKRRVGAAE